MELPLPLAPWREHLSGFDPDVVGVLADLLRRLQPLLGAADAPRRHGQHHYDGVDGLQRNGSYERLLASEWALAEVEPDEFLRRAAVGEHLFLAPRRVQPRAGSLIVALFDSGPGQLGAPRLVHLALAVLLGQRAAALDARFAWACLQERGELVELNQPVHLQRLLRSHTLRPADAADLDYWDARCADPAPAECWLIGASTAPGPVHSHVVAVQRRLDGMLDVRVRNRSRLRELVLQPPQIKAAVRLLRGDFSSTAADTPRSSATRMKQRLSLSHAPLLDWRGKRLGLAVLDSTSLVYVRQEPGGRVSRTPLHWRRGASLLSAVFGNANLGGVVLGGDQLRGWNLRQFERWPRPEPTQLACVPGQGHWLRGVLLDQNSAPPSLLLLDRNGNLVEWVCETRDSALRGLGRPNAIRLHQHWRGVLALQQSGPSHALIAVMVAGCFEVICLHQGQKREPLLAVTRPSPVPDTAFIAGSMMDARWRGSCAYATTRGSGSGTSATTWQLLHQEENPEQRTRSVELPPNCLALGLVRVPNAAQQHGLLALDQSRRRLRVFAEAPHELYLSDAPILRTTVSDDGTRVAILTERREVLLIETATRQVVLHLGNSE